MPPAGVCTVGGRARQKNKLSHTYAMDCLWLADGTRLPQVQLAVDGLWAGMMIGTFVRAINAYKLFETAQPQLWPCATPQMGVFFTEFESDMSLCVASKPFKVSLVVSLSPRSIVKGMKVAPCWKGSMVLNIDMPVKLQVRGFILCTSLPCQRVWAAKSLQTW